MISKNVQMAVEALYFLKVLETVSLIANQELSDSRSDSDDEVSSRQSFSKLKIK
jgi:hypothetical protein